MVDLNQLLDSEDIVIAYFSHDRCSVCKVLLPKVEGLIKEDFPKAKLIYCNIEQAPEAAAQNTVFTAPSIIIFVAGKEYIRYSRNIGLNQLAQSLSRPYNLLFNQ